MYTLLDILSNPVRQILTQSESLVQNNIYESNREPKINLLTEHLVWKHVYSLTKLKLFILVNYCRWEFYLSIYSRLHLPQMSIMSNSRSKFSKNSGHTYCISNACQSNACNIVFDRHFRWHLCHQSHNKPSTAGWLTKQFYKEKLQSTFTTKKCYTLIIFDRNFCI